MTSSPTAGGAKGQTSQPDPDDEYFDSEEDDEIYETMDDAPMMIEQGVYIGSFLSEQNQKALTQAGVTHVLQVADGMQPSHLDHFKYKTIHAQDIPSEDLVSHFSQCFPFMDEAVSQGGGVLVHCVAGVSRSATVIIGYMMWKHKIGYDEAFKRIHGVRPWVMPNEGFKLQLAEFEKINCDLNSWKSWNPSKKTQFL